MGHVFVITGPSGVGKGTLIRTLLQRIPELELSVSATTRDPRPGETDGVEYHFLDDPEFDGRVLAGDFVEHAGYSGRRYGTLRERLPRFHLSVSATTRKPRAGEVDGRDYHFLSLEEF
ncbi:MAG TPA: hypothetical protein VGN78_17010, partial [Solirubrobacteraceae bacterium]|nr:hypothetical protein [Solirubrobacteraceae bacterium]